VGWGGGAPDIENPKGIYCHRGGGGAEKYP